MHLDIDSKKFSFAPNFSLNASGAQPRAKDDLTVGTRLSSYADANRSQTLKALDLPAASPGTDQSVILHAWGAYYELAKRSRAGFPVTSLSQLSPKLKDNRLLKNWEERLKLAQASTDIEPRHAAVAQYNVDIAPHANIEESALSVMAQRLSYTFLTPECPVQLNVTHCLSGFPVHCYSKENRVAQIEVGKKHGCQAYLVEPKDLSDKGASIIYFTGTNAGAGRDVLMRYYRSSGLFADGERHLGRSEYEEISDTLLTWVKDALTDDRPVTVVGHSLGGAFARRLVAALTQEQQKNVRLVTFCPAGIEQETCSKIAPKYHSTVFHEADPVVLFSGNHPTGTYYEVTNPIPIDDVIGSTHSPLFIAQWELHGAPVTFRSVSKPTTAFVNVGAVGRATLNFVFEPIFRGLGLAG